MVTAHIFCAKFSLIQLVAIFSGNQSPFSPNCNRSIFEWNSRSKEDPLDDAIKSLSKFVQNFGSKRIREKRRQVDKKKFGEYLAVF